MSPKHIQGGIYSYVGRGRPNFVSAVLTLCCRENLDACIQREPVRLYFDSARNLELFASSYDTTPVKDIEIVLSYYDTPTVKRLSALSKFRSLSRLQVFWNVFPESCPWHKTEIEHRFASFVRAECDVAVTFQEWRIRQVSKGYAKILPNLFNLAECCTNNDDPEFYHYHFPQLYPPHSGCRPNYLIDFKGNWVEDKHLLKLYASLVAAQGDMPSIEDAIAQVLN